MSLFQPIFQPNKDLPTHFREIGAEIQAVAARYKVDITPFWDNDLPHFCKLNEKKQLDVLKIMTHQRDFLVTAETDRLHPNDPKLIWRTLGNMGMTPLPDIFDKITEDDTVEVYHWDSTTSFKNLKFFEFISLSLEEIYCLTWMEQRTHSPGVFLFFLEMNAKLRLAQVTKTFAPRFSKYFVTEKLAQKRRFHIHLKWISPVTQDGVKSAIICVNRSSFA